MSAAILREMAVGELLLASYHGCTETNGRIDGICFSEYPESLMMKLNPGSLNENDFLQDRQVPKEDAARYRRGVKAGVDHLHSLGYVHNDINRANIMITEAGDAILVDFDSCLKIGTPLAGVKRTYGWHSTQARTAEQKSDHTAIEDLETWLTGSSFGQVSFQRFLDALEPDRGSEISLLA